MTAVNPGKTDLIAWWELNEESGTRVDAHGSNDLADNNTVLFSAGIVGNAAQYVNANTEFLSIADNDELSSGDVFIHWLTWVYLDNKTTQQLFINKITGPNDFEYNVVYNLASDRLRLAISTEGTAGGVVTIDATTLGSPAIATWYMVDCYHDPTANLLAIRVNDGVKDTTAHAGGIYSSASNFRLGGGTGGASGMDGRQDITVIRKGSLFSDDEIEWHYNSGSGRAYSELGTFIPKVTSIF